MEDKRAIWLQNWALRRNTSPNAWYDRPWENFSFRAERELVLESTNSFQFLYTYALYQSWGKDYPSHPFFQDQFAGYIPSPSPLAPSQGTLPAPTQLDLSLDGLPRDIWQTVLDFWVGTGAWKVWSSNPHLPPGIWKQVPWNFMRGAKGG